ncbi:MAG: hypothetical protein ACOYLI_03540 [Synechococcus lacustris]|jgi:hypothetical protein
MFLPLKPGELQRLIPAVASGPQFSFCWGNPQRALQRILISSLGGVIPLLISGSAFGSRWSGIWLVGGLTMLLYLLWGPILEAGRRNSQLRRYPAAALFEGVIADLYTKERLEGRQEQTDKQGRLELVENRRTWLCLELEDEDGYLGQLRFPLDKKHKAIRRGMTIRCLVLSERPDFSRIARLSDGWIPQAKLWVGDYPYLLRPAFEELCLRRLR